VNNIAVTPVFDVDTPASTLLAAVYPNPAQPGTLLELNIPQTGNTEISLLDMGGHRLQMIQSGNLTRGNHLLQLGHKLDKLSPGLYLLRISTGKESKILKIIIP